MGCQALPGELFVLCAGLAIVGVWMDGDAAARREEAGDLNIAGLHQADEVLHDDVDAVLVEVAVIAEGEEVEFQTLALDHLLVGYIGDDYFGEVGLAGDGTEAGKFGTIELDPIVVVGMFVDEGFEHLGGIVGFIDRLPVAEQGERGFVFSFHVYIS